MATDGAEVRRFCGNCCWGEFGSVEDKGLCRINPPATFMGRDAIVACWPRVKRTDWCGAHSRYNEIVAEQS